MPRRSANVRLSEWTGSSRPSPRSARLYIRGRKILVSRASLFRSPALSGPHSSPSILVSGSRRRSARQSCKLTLPLPCIWQFSAARLWSSPRRSPSRQYPACRFAILIHGLACGSPRLLAVVHWKPGASISCAARLCSAHAVAKLLPTNHQTRTCKCLILSMTGLGARPRSDE